MSGQTEGSGVEKTFTYARKTDAELERLAQDIVSGHVFHSAFHGKQIKEAGLRPEMVWMPLALLDPESARALAAANIAAVYEYLDKAAPRSVNGLPCFFSMGTLDFDDNRRLYERVVDIDRIMRSRRGAEGIGA